MPHDPDRQTSLDDLLAQHLHQLLGDLDPESLALLRAQFEWVELPAGQTLMRQGDPGDAMYLLVSGRLRTFIAEGDGPARRVRDVGRGQVVGEMSLYTHDPRSATLVALRDSVLVRLDKARFHGLLGRSAQLSIALTRQIIQRLQTEAARVPVDRPVTIGLLPVSDGVALADLAARLAEEMGRHRRVAVVDAARAEAELGGAPLSEAAGTGSDRRIAAWIDRLEATHDHVLLLADAGPTPWTARCIRHADELLLLADADQPPRIHATEAALLDGRDGDAHAAEVLVLLHPAERASPRDSHAWLSRRPVADHVQLRPSLERDIARLARLQCRTGVGLVLAGGGARGLAHLGIYRALQERGIEVDVVGGTSIGSVMAVLVASDRSIDDVTTIAREAFGSNPTGDFNLVPLLSLIKGQRLRGIVQRAIGQLAGGAIGGEDLWKGWFCVATNYTRAREQVLRRGSLHKALMSSIAIPGALPPVIADGELLCDGGTFNNFPVDVMRGMRGVGQVIGVDLQFPNPRRIPHEDVPGPWALLRDRLRPRRSRRYRLPSLPAYLMNVTILCSSARQREARRLTDLYFNPPLDRVGMLQWNRFDHIVRQGYEHACAVLDRATAAARSPDPLGR